MAPNLTASEWMMLPFNILILLVKISLCYVEALYYLFVPRASKSFRGKVVLVTGAGQGIGRQLALKFSSEGSRLALWDINKAGVDETASMITENGGSAFSYSCDITKVENVKEAAVQTRRDLGDVDIIVNNAGIMVTKPFMKLTESDIRRTFDINIVSHFWVIQEFLPKMLERNEGHIVTIASMAGRVGTPLLTDYCGSKWAAVGFTEALAEEMRKQNKDIQTTIVCPMFVNTNLVNGVRDRAQMRDKFGKLLEPTEVAAAIVEGVKRNEHSVFVPASAVGSTVVGPLLPRRAKHILTDFLDACFVEVTS